MFDRLKQHGMTFVVVAEDMQTNKIVASGTIMIEEKFIHGCSRVRHLFMARLVRYMGRPSGHVHGMCGIQGIVLLVLCR